MKSFVNFEERRRQQRASPAILAAAQSFYDEPPHTSYVLALSFTSYCIVGGEVAAYTCPLFSTTCTSASTLANVWFGC